MITISRRFAEGRFTVFIYILRCDLCDVVSHLSPADPWLLTRIASLFSDQNKRQFRLSECCHLVLSRVTC